MENRPAETNSEVDKSASPSVAQLAGKFKEQAANITAKEVPPHKPTRRKPPCSLPLYSHKTETSDNDEQKRSPNACPLPKVKVKSSPMIEKLQANLAFSPAALLPGVSPKSPGLKALVSPFSTPPSTPSSPGTQIQPSEASETPVSFDQPPEGTQLQFYNKVRTRGSIKRRPPSRRFRRSLSEYGDGEDLGLNISSPENGAREDEVFGPNGKTEEAETGRKEQKKESGSDEKPQSRRGSSRSEDELKGSNEQKKQSGSDEKPPSRRGSSKSEDEEKGDKQAEEINPCKSNKGNTEEEEVCHDAPGKENSAQPTSENKEVCEGPKGEEQQDTASEQEKGDKEKEEVEAEAKETSESTDTQRTSDTEETPLASESLQDAEGLDTASEASPSVTQEQSTA
ncbi:capZ-interacting protein isoform X1 [Myiozetetes cayanensis]|uniref:capZ-interacting protein isoform X1 n=1 Tax=Myiozetetes cayanensis TaxID=478635 RepID=UPI00216026B5|nr:capZ-interacting protein isoform X1 [Myiozetetes cayanensis]XP_050189616.1 capZ-interacting protein isoform X1 [Myiozetetes cayanensis]XP_050189617.1 capZ-interacting protein isoform X1 [Myiozetetes cayanensis]